MSSVIATSAPAPRFRKKTVAATLALLLGWAGAHHAYLGRRLAWVPLVFTALIVGIALWRDPPLFSQLPYYLVLIPLAAGFIESVVLCLTADARFDARYNVGQERRSANRWGAIVLGMVALNLGMFVILLHVVMASLAMVDGTLGL